MLVDTIELVIDALCCDGEHHKQWYLEEILGVLCDSIDIKELRDQHDWQEGTPP